MTGPGRVDPFDSYLQKYGRATSILDEEDPFLAYQTKYAPPVTTLPPIQAQPPAAAAPAPPARPGLVKRVLGKLIPGAQRWAGEEPPEDRFSRYMQQLAGEFPEDWQAQPGYQEAARAFTEEDRVRAAQEAAMRPGGKPGIVEAALVAGSEAMTPGFMKGQPVVQTRHTFPTPEPTPRYPTEADLTRTLEAAGPALARTVVPGIAFPQTRHTFPAAPTPVSPPITGADVVAAAAAAGTVGKEYAYLETLGPLASRVAAPIRPALRAIGRVVAPAKALVPEALAGARTIPGAMTAVAEAATTGAAAATAFGLFREAAEKGEVSPETLQEALHYAPWGAALGALFSVAGRAQLGAKPTLKVDADDPFVILGLDRATATPADVARAVRQKAMIWHPDINPAAEAGEVMAKYNAAASAAEDILAGRSTRARPAQEAPVRPQEARPATPPQEPTRPPERPAPAQPAPTGAPVVSVTPRTAAPVEPIPQPLRAEPPPQAPAEGPVTAPAALARVPADVSAEPPERIVGGGRPLEEVRAEEEAKRRSLEEREQWPALSRDEQRAAPPVEGGGRGDEVDYRERIRAALADGRVPDARALYAEATKLVGDPPDQIYDVFAPDTEIESRISRAEQEVARQTEIPFAIPRPPVSRRGEPPLVRQLGAAQPPQPPERAPVASAQEVTAAPPTGEGAIGTALGRPKRPTVSPMDVRNAGVDAYNAALQQFYSEAEKEGLSVSAAADAADEVRKGGDPQMALASRGLPSGKGLVDRLSAVGRLNAGVQAAGTAAGILPYDEAKLIRAQLEDRGYTREAINTLTSDLRDGVALVALANQENLPGYATVAGEAERPGPREQAQRVANDLRKIVDEQQQPIRRRLGSAAREIEAGNFAAAARTLRAVIETRGGGEAVSSPTKVDLQNVLTDIGELEKPVTPQVEAIPGTAPLGRAPTQTGAEEQRPFAGLQNPVPTVEAARELAPEDLEVSAEATAEELLGHRKAALHAQQELDTGRSLETNRKLTPKQIEERKFTISNAEGVVDGMLAEYEARFGADQADVIKQAVEAQLQPTITPQPGAVGAVTPAHQTAAAEARRIAENQPAGVARTLESVARQLEQADADGAAMQVRQVLASRGEGQTKRDLQNLLVDIAQFGAQTAEEQGFTVAGRVSPKVYRSPSGGEETLDERISRVQGEIDTWATNRPTGWEDAVRTREAELARLVQDREKARAQGTVTGAVTPAPLPVGEETPTIEGGEEAPRAERPPAPRAEPTGEPSRPVPRVAGERPARAAPEQPRPEREGPAGETPPAVGGEEPVQPGGVEEQPERLGGVVEPHRGRTGVERPRAGEGRGDRESGDRGVHGLNFRADPAELGAERSLRQKVVDNIAAIRLLKTIEEAGRPATRAEQEILAKYAGWGFAPQAFEPYRKTEFSQFADELQELLSPEEYEAGRRSTINAHYTSPEVITAIWDMMARLGFKSGLVLEPGMGVGYFFALVPRNLVGSTRFTGVELDSVTGRIAKLLFPRADIRVQGFQDMQGPDNFYDLSLGNVPFGDFRVHDPRYNKYRFNIHNYFFAKALDRVKPGGVVAFITSRYTMDSSKYIDARRYLAERANLVAAIRLPNTAFKRVANTDVTSDLIILQKHGPGITAGGPKWIDLREVEVDLEINEYYADHPEQMLGKMALTGTQWAGQTPTLEPIEGANLADLLAAVAKRLPEGIIKPPEPKPVADLTQPETILAPDHVKEGAFTVREGKLYQRRASVLQLVNKNVQHDRVKALVGIRDATRAVIRSQLADEPQAEITKKQQTLTRLYDRFVKNYGPINKTSGNRLPNLETFREDPDAPLVVALERVDVDHNLYAKAAIFTQRVIQPPKPIDAVDRPQDALFAVLNERGKVDVARMADLSTMPEAAVLEALEGQIFQNPETQEWEPAARYLAGNVRKKLALARGAAAADPRYEGNVKALERVQPDDLPPSRIAAYPGAPWIPPEDIEQFIVDTVNKGYEIRGLKVYHRALDASWTVDAPPILRNRALATQTWGTERRPFTDLLETIMNLKDPKVYDRDTSGKPVLNQSETIAAQEKAANIRERFAAWLWEDDARASRLHRVYNDGYNNIVDLAYDGNHLTLPGSAQIINGEDFQLRAAQKNLIYRALQEGNTGIFHAVGGGKTYAMIGLAMEAKRIGFAKKPMITVPNHMLEQWTRMVLQMYPNANILMATKEDLAREKRQAFIAKVATNDWDAVIITHSSFGKIPISPEFESRFIKEQLTLIEEAIQATLDQAVEAGANPRRQRSLVKQIEKVKERLEARLLELSNRDKKDDLLSFEEMGTDMLLVDEAHLFKNLYAPTKMERVNTGDAKRAMDLYMKTRYLHKLNPGRGVYFATGTPIANSVVEAWTMMRYLAPETLAELQMEHLDAWAAVFGEVVTQLELRPEGGFRMHQRFARFRNVPALTQMFRHFADVQTAEMLKLPRPDVQGGAPEVVAAPRSDALNRIMEWIQARAEAIRGGKVDPKQDNMLALSVDGRKAGLDVRLVDPQAPDEPTSKVNLAVDRIYGEWEKTRDIRATQLVFIDMSTPTVKRGKKEVAATGFTVYDDMKTKLIKRGIPADDIAFAHDAQTDRAKEQLYQQMRLGTVRILFGSTEKLGIGTNIQDRLIAMHELDAPWRPDQVEQRAGRILRPGNQHAMVRLYRYVTEGSFDGYIWQTLEYKARMIDQLMRAGADVDTIEDVDARAFTFAEVKAITTGNPLVLEKASVDMEIVRLLRLERAFHDQQFSVRQQLAEAPGKRRAIEFELGEFRADAAKLLDRSGEKFTIKLGDQTFTERKAAGEAVLNLLPKLVLSRETRVGEFAGLPLGMLQGIIGNVHIYLDGRVRQYETRIGLGTSPAGAIQAIEYLPERVVRTIAAAEQELRELDAMVVDLTPTADRTFEYKDKLDELRKRQKEIDAALDIDKQRSDVAQDDTQPKDDVEQEEDVQEDEDPEDVGFPRLSAAPASPSGMPIGYRLRGQVATPPDWKPGDSISRPQVMAELSKIAQAAGRNVPIRFGRVRGRMAGFFRVRPEVIRIRKAYDLPTAAHEVAHATEKLVFGWPKGGPWKKPLASRLMQMELTKLGHALYGTRKPAAGYKREGFAEFWRMWLEEDGELGKVAPRFLEWFEDDFLPQHEAIGEASAAARQALRTWRTQGARERARMSMVDVAAPGERLKRGTGLVKRFFSMGNLVESLQPVYELAKEAEQHLRRELQPSENPYTLAAALRTTHSARTKYMVERGMIDLAGNVVGPPLMDIRPLVAGRYTDFVLYLWARRALALWDDPRGARDPGISHEDAQQIVDELGAITKSPSGETLHAGAFELASSKVYDWNAGVLDYAAQASPLFARIVEKVRDRDPGEYVPLRRAFEELDDLWARSAREPSAGRRSPVQRLRGSGRRVKDPLQQMIAQTEQIIRAAHQRAILDAIVKVSRVEGMGHLVEEVPRDQVPGGGATIADLMDRIEKETGVKFGGVWDELEERDLLGQMLTFFMPAQRPKGADPVLPVMQENGEVAWFRLDGQLFDVMAGLDVYRLPDVAGFPLLEWVLGKPTALFRAGTTGLRASFGLVWNVWRDVQTLMVNTRSSALAPKMLYFWAKGIKDGLLDRGFGVEGSPYYEALIRLGGEMATSLGQDIPHTRLAARRLTETTAEKALDVRNYFEWYRDVVQAPEMGPRAAEIEARAPDVGWVPGTPMTLDQALQLLLDAKQVTTDFTAGGWFARVMNRIVPFHNAAIQGPRANIRAAKDHPSRFVLRGLELTAATLALWWLVKDEDWYKEMNFRDRFLHWWFKVDDKTLVKIPRSFEIGLVFSGLPEALVDSWYRQEPDAVKAWLGVTAQNALPNMSPVVFEEAAEQMLNKDLYFHTPIVPRGEEMRPAEEQYNEYTSRVAIFLGKTFNASPRRIDHAITGIFGYVGGDILSVVGLGPSEMAREKELADIPLVGRMFQRGGELGTRPQSIQKLYDRLEEMQRHQQSFKNPETEDERQRRLMLTDAAQAVTALAYVRRYTPALEKRQALMREGLTIAREAIKAAETGEFDRTPFATARRTAEERRDLMEPPGRGTDRRRVPPRPRVPSRPR